jgi:Flp pilus assembly protein TadG
MTVREIWQDTEGNALVELSITFPLFIMLVFGIIQAGMFIWIWVGLQHGVEMASRCATVSDYAIRAGFAPSTTTPTACYTTNGTAASGTATTGNLAAVRAYAARNSWGVSPAGSIFSVSTTSAGCSGGNFISVSGYAVNLMHYLFSVSLNAQSCYAG